MSCTRMLVLVVVMSLVHSAGCASDSVGDDGPGGGNNGGADAGPPPPDAEPASVACDMTGVWIAAQTTVSLALSADQVSTNWFYYDITQDGDTFTINKSLNCGFVVDGTTTVTLGEDTLEALAKYASAGLGRQGTFVETSTGCDFDLDRSYNLRGAAKTTYLTDHWNIGDPPKPLSDFPVLPDGPGMEDWDEDGMHGISLTTGLGGRYVAQRDWNEHHGTVEKFSNQFGGEGVIAVPWDTQEMVSDQTSILLRATATPKGDGWAQYARVGDTLTVVETGSRPELETCRNVQQLAQQVWP